MKKWRTVPISRRILIPMVLLIIIEILLLAGSMFWGGLISHLEQNEKDIFKERVVNRKNYLEREMISNWSNITDTAQTINEKTAAMIETGEISIKTLDQGSEFCESLVLNISDDLISLMRSNRVTGAFVVFNTDNLKDLQRQGRYENKPGIYIRDFDPISNSNERNQDLLLEYAPTSVVQSLNISTDSAWRPQFEFKKSSSYSPFLYEPFQAAYGRQSMAHGNLSDYGYWSEPYCLEGDDKEVISYSVPLVLDDGTIYGVLGIDLTLDYLKSIIPYEEVSNDKSGSYIIGIDTNGDMKFQNVLISGPAYAQIASDSEETNVYKNDGDMYIQTDNEEAMYCVTEYLNLYNSNTSFSSQQWALLGTVSCKTLFAFSDQTSLILITAIVITLLVGIGGSIVISQMISKPVMSLAKSMNQADSSKSVTLPRIGIKEIDTMSESLENLSREVIYSAEKFSHIVNMTSIKLAVFEMDRVANTIYMTDKFFSIFNSEADVASVTVEKFKKIMTDYEPYRQQVEKDVFVYKLPVNNEFFPFRYIKLTIMDDGERCIGLAEDITNATVEMETIEHERDHDLLTGLINRRAFNRIMNHLFSQGKPVMKTAALIMMDLDDLKYINDTYGHDYGDQYIRCAADCFITFTPKSTVVARYSGDEFFLFFYGYDSKEEIRSKIADMRAGINSRTIALPSQPPRSLKISGGIAWYPEDSTSLELLLRYADFAMYKVKHSVKGELSDFDLGTYNNETYRLQNKAELNELIEKQAVQFHFQPIVDAKTGEIFAYEALMRAHMSTLKTPDEIFTLARLEFKLNQMETIAWFKSMEAFTALARENKITEDQKIFINSVPNHIVPEDKLKVFEEQYRDYLQRIVLEITEEEEQQEDIREKKKDLLKRWGAQVALDDYGSGYNSEKALLSLAPHFIKVDLSIIRNINTDRDKQKIVENIVSYAHERNMQVIAEGVENSAEAETVINMGVDYLQGFFLAVPLSVPAEISEEVKEIIRRVSKK